MTPPADDDPFAKAVKPLVDAIGGELIAPDRAQDDDVVLSWEGREVVAVRLPHLSDSLDHILAELRRRHGVPLADLDRKTKQSVVRLLEQRGAFSMRHGVETVATALGVSRFTVYNYINYANEQRAKARGGGGTSDPAHRDDQVG
ncbi:helix-turn-helix domain-containing protein [Streptomyces sp. NPDC097640]|uniref:helix-turn-helix domain-containing protein n=1 Tax=Streptomyces sp. NPDC097640 TaxID=3157229 RepID=UPI00331ED90E